MEIAYTKACELIKAAEAPTSNLVELTKERLSELVGYAREHAPLFGDLYRNVKDNSDLKSLPVTEKRSLMSRMDDWFCDREVTKEKLFAYLAQDLETPFLEKYTVLTTSGSTGMPMAMVRDANHNAIHGALMSLRFFRNIDQALMQPAHSKIAAIIFTSGSVSSYSSLKKSMRANKAYVNNMLPISVLNPIDDIVKALNDFQPDVITGYPTVLALLANESEKGILNIHPKLIACSAETLSLENYHYLKDTFGCAVLNNYCSTEGGEIAMSCSEGHLHLNSDWILVEPIDKEGKEVADGVLSDEVLITDLSNYIQPVIRYRVDDQVRIWHTPCKCGSRLPIIEVIGRVEDSLCLCGKTISSVQILVLISKISEFISSQFIQTNECCLEFRGTVADHTDKAAVVGKLKDAIHTLFASSGCPDAQLIITEKPVLKNPNGGKTKVIINQFAGKRKPNDSKCI